MTINREHFEAWLFSQPKRRVMNYVEGGSDHRTGCLMCNYLRENFVVRATVSPFSIFTNTGKYPLPKWFVELVCFAIAKKEPTFTIAEAQAEYLKLFPDTVPAPALPVQLTGGQAV